jgi:hypothetical protein
MSFEKFSIIVSAIWTALCCIGHLYFMYKDKKECGDWK